jgi:hypothetical protein
LESRVPDHSTFSKARHGRFQDSDVFCHVFETRFGAAPPARLRRSSSRSPIPRSSGRPPTRAMPFSPTPTII